MTGFWPTVKNPISGVFVAQQSAAFTRLGCDVTVVAVRNAVRVGCRLLTPLELGPEYDRLAFVEAPVLLLPEVMLAAPCVPFANAWMSDRSLSIQLWKAGIASDYDSLVVHGLRYVGLSMPMLKRHVRGRALMVLHGRDPRLQDPATRARFSSSIEAAKRACDSTILVGTSLQEYALSLGILPERTIVIGNGTILPCREGVSLRQRSTDERRIVLSVSNLLPWKGIDLNLRALASVRAVSPTLDWEYRIVGDGPELNRLVSLTDMLGLTDRVRFLGRLSYEESMNEMAGCDVFSMPSWAEAFGIVYLEAMARGRPVIGCRDNGPADFITDGHDGFLVPPHDVNALADRLGLLLLDPAQATEMGKNALDTAQAHSWDANARRFLELLN